MKPCLALAALVALSIPASAEPKMIELKTELPPVQVAGTPVPIKVPNLEPVPDKAPSLMVPEGTVNLALKKTVTASDTFPAVGELEQITDGDKAGAEGSFIELGPDAQWVQVDLGDQSAIYAIWLWHYHSQRRVYHDVVVQVSDDPDFLSEVKTVYNNDADNTIGKGAGKDRPYIETNLGKLIAVNGVKGRYVRLYSKGNTTDSLNHYIEVEVFGTPAP